jgi:hypothetical protein
MTFTYAAASSKSFKPFNRFAPFKTFPAKTGSKRSKGPFVQSSRSSPATKNQERSRSGGVKRVPQFMIDRISDAGGITGLRYLPFH